MYIDVHKAIRRLAPAPKAKFRQGSEDLGRSDDTTVVGGEAEEIDTQKILRRSVGSIGALAADGQMLSSSPKATTFLMRRRSVDGQAMKAGIPVRANIQEMREHLKHLGPSNPATNPKGTRSTTVKIKPGIGPGSPSQPRAVTVGEILEDAAADGEDETTSLLRPQLSGKDGVQALKLSYGSTTDQDAAPAVSADAGIDTLATVVEALPAALGTIETDTQTSSKAYPHEPSPSRPSSSEGSGQSSPTVRRQYVRSGSITENVIESRGVRKVVLETSSSTAEAEFGIAGSGSSGPASPTDIKTTQSKTSLKLVTPQVPEEEEADGDEEDVLSPSTEHDALLSPDGEGSAGAEEHQASQASQGNNEGNGNKTGKKKNRRKKRRGGGS